MLGIVWFFSQRLTREEIQLVSKVAANLILLSDHRGFICGALWKRANVFDAFIDGRQGRHPDVAHDHPVPRGHAGGDQRAAQLRRARVPRGRRGVGRDGDGIERRSSRRRCRRRS
jgi:hypothetical protein